jgi:hypothetical protein
MLQSTNVENPISHTMYDDLDEGISIMIAPTHDEHSIPCPIYDIYDDACMIVPEICVEDNEGDDLVDRDISESLYEKVIPHYTSSYSDTIDTLCDIPCHVDQITLHELED